MNEPSPTPTPARSSPERTCVACRRRRPQPEFLRVSRVGGVWAVRPGHRVGRGAYVCADSPGCWQDRRLRRAFGAQAPAVSAALLLAASPGAAPASASGSLASAPAPAAAQAGVPEHPQIP